MAEERLALTELLEKASPMETSLAVRLLVRNTCLEALETKQAESVL